MDEAQSNVGGQLKASPKVNGQTGAVETPQGGGAVALAKNYFLELLPDAISEMRHILKTSKVERMRLEAAESIIEKAGAGGGPKTAPVVINDSQVVLLTGAFKELFE